MHKTLISHALRHNCPAIAIRPHTTIRFYRIRPFKEKRPLALCRREYGLPQPSEHGIEQHVSKNDGAQEEALKVTRPDETCLDEGSKSSTSPESTVTERRQSSFSGEKLNPSALEDHSRATSKDGSSSTWNPIVDVDADEDEEPMYRRLDARPMQFRPFLREVQRIGRITGHHKYGPIRSLDRKLASTQILEDELRWIAKTRPQPNLTREILNILIEDRKIKPRPDHYEALILANCAPEYGSADNVQTILDEMEREGIVMSPSVYYAALMALTVHPDTHLRTTILQRLAQQWVTIPPLYAQLNIVAMVREGQLELATIELENLQQDGMRIETWVWTIYMHAICDQGDYEALLQLCYKLYDLNFPFPRHTLLHALRVASRKASRVESRRFDDAAASLTKWIWYTYVENMHIIPDRGMCTNVLRIAVRTSDVDLAESASVVLENAAAGETTTTPPILAPWERDDLKPTLDSPELLGLDPASSTSASDPPSMDEKQKKKKQQQHEKRVQQDFDPGETVDEERAVAFSTPPDLPSQPLPPRRLPEPVRELLQRVQAGAAERPDHLSDAPRRRNPAVLYKFFRKESGLRGARFDPLLALKEGWNWRKK
ncbi:hypothetical protein PV08_06671 [Exophiala spinifera]|uniref:Pentacotripeptide-repeat region of PRORP domain-containing protein n=1 Tax=Exophiala spinifera TaxID=91928 RepID=A0A0D2B5B4_9EURO|nr:uncharacterized protein PV08_06671 [Exophiala spinifera]KIW13890.1 hypothetical protein PV08_06671 [Exophiala spinifera]